MDVGEVGAVEKIGGRYHMLVGMNEERLGSRTGWRFPCGRMGMYHFIADDPGGPFRPAKEHFRLLTSTDWMTYFCRFYPTPDATLVCHHSWEKYVPGAPIYLAPLKQAIFTDAGDMQLAWWRGNNVLLDSARPVDTRNGKWTYTGRGTELEADGQGIRMADNVGGAVWMADESFSPQSGGAICATVTIAPKIQPIGATGVVISCEHGNVAILMDTGGRTLLGMLHPDGIFIGEDMVETGIAAGTQHNLILLVRESLLELYLDGLLVQCFSMKSRATGRWGFVLESADVRVDGIMLSDMGLGTVEFFP